MTQSFFDYSDEVKAALAANQPVLALESTLITHGLPFPHNIETALACETIAREHHVTPATIAIINGRIKIGLTHNQLEHIATIKNVVKTSCHDLPFTIAQELTGGTTVAATLFCAKRAGIRVFATGGIGGVHRGDAQDISADLIELAKTPIAVICAGAKAILDLPRTMELLETLSVPVIGYRTDVLPAFYMDKTSHKLSTTVNDITSLAKLLCTHWNLGFTSGQLIVNPIPSEFAISADVMEPVIANAILKAELQKISGKALTPFLLTEVAQSTKGESLRSNLALIKNNVRLGAELATELTANIGVTTI